MKRFSWGLVGAIFVTLLGLTATAWTAWFLAHAERATGRAGHTSYRSSTTSKSAGTFTVYVTFATKAGEGKTVGITTLSGKSYPDGSPVPVIYDPRSPGGTARLDTFLDLWVMPAALLLWGVWWLVRAWRRSSHT